MKKLNKYNKTLGELEAEIMETIWELELASVRSILDKIKKRRKIAYTTVMTVMNRLCKKGFLKRELNESNKYMYMPSQSKYEFLDTASKNAVDALLKEFGDIAVSNFIEKLEKTDINIKKLEKTQRNKKRKKYEKNRV